MANPYYTHTGYPQNSAEGQAVDSRAEFKALEAGFDKFPTLTGHALELLQVNAGGTGITSIPFATGVWLPVFSFSTPGNSVFVYSVQDGYFVRIGPIILIAMRLLFSTFTHTTASGNAKITGLPFSPTAINNAAATMAIYGQGITKAGHTQVLGMVNSTNAVQLVARGSGVSESPVSAADMPTAGVPSLYGSVVYRTDQ